MFDQKSKRKLDAMSAQCDVLSDTSYDCFSSAFADDDTMSTCTSVPDGHVGGGKPKRIRQKLDHLSQEEKMARRKMKNRVAAQSARDRKRVSGRCFSSFAVAIWVTDALAVRGRCC